MQKATYVLYPPKLPPTPKVRGARNKLQNKVFGGILPKALNRSRAPKIDVAIPCVCDTSRNKQVSTPQVEVMMVKHENNHCRSVQNKTIILGIFGVQPLRNLDNSTFQWEVAKNRLGIWKVNYFRKHWFCRLSKTTSPLSGKMPLNQLTRETLQNAGIWRPREHMVRKYPYQHARPCTLKRQEYVPLLVPSACMHFDIKLVKILSKRAKENATKRDH